MSFLDMVGVKSYGTAKVSSPIVEKESQTLRYYPR